MSAPSRHAPCGYSYKRELGVDELCGLPSTHVIVWWWYQQGYTVSVCCAEHARVMGLRANPHVVAIAELKPDACPVNDCGETHE